MRITAILDFQKRALPAGLVFTQERQGARADRRSHRFLLDRIGRGWLTIGCEKFRRGSCRSHPSVIPQLTRRRLVKRLVLVVLSVGIVPTVQKRVQLSGDILMVCDHRIDAAENRSVGAIAGCPAAGDDGFGSCR